MNSSGPRSAIGAYGVKVLLARHATIRRLKRRHRPSEHGNRFWSSSWLLMDFLKRKDLPLGFNVMDVGCGWGLAGIYCAKQHDAIVTGVDADSEVFPYLRLHAEINSVRLATLHKTFDELRGRHLKGVDLLIGADICFWDSMIDSLRKLILRAGRSGVRLVLIADPGRSTFHRLAEYFVERGRGEVLKWSVRRPRPIEGSILKVGAITG